MRLIDAKKLRDAIIQMTTDHRKDDFGGQLLHYTGVIAEIDSAQTVDAEPVVRCKDCKYSEPWYADKRLCSLWYAEENAGAGVWEDGYCSYGKRREDGDGDG